MELRKSTQEDMAFVRQNPFEGAVKNYPYMEIPHENCYTAIYESAIVGVGGMIILWDGVGEVWLMLTADCKKYGIFGIVAFEALRKKVDELIEEHKMRRVQATIRTDFPKAKKMIKALGFELEGIMRAYAPDGADVELYARLTEWK